MGSSRWVGLHSKFKFWWEEKIGNNNLGTDEDPRMVRVESVKHLGKGRYAPIT